MSTYTTTARTILAASFPTSDGAARAAGSVAGALPESVGNTAVVWVLPDGTPKFHESKDWGAGRGGLVGGALGLIIGPVGMLVGTGAGILAAKLRDAGFRDNQLEKLGRTLGPDDSVVVFDLNREAILTASNLLASLGASQIVTADIDANVAALFALAE